MYEIVLQEIARISEDLIDKVEPAERNLSLLQDLLYINYLARQKDNEPKNTTDIYEPNNRPEQPETV